MFPTGEYMSRPEPGKSTLDKDSIDLEKVVTFYFKWLYNLQILIMAIFRLSSSPNLLYKYFLSQFFNRRLSPHFCGN